MTQKPTEPKIGQRMLDGSIYVGVSPDTGKAMYVADDRSRFTRFMDVHQRVSGFLNKHPKIYRLLLRVAHHIPVLKEHVPLFPPILPFNEALKYTKELNAYGHSDWPVPTKAELNLLFNNRAASGGHDISHYNSAGWYWSSTDVPAPGNKEDAASAQQKPPTFKP